MPEPASSPLHPTVPRRWPALVQALHWIGVALILAVAIIGLVMVELPRGTGLRKFFYPLHKSLGISVLALAALRLAVRALTRAPAALPAPPWQRRTAAASHALLYLLMLVLPLSGWLLNSFAGQPLPWFGLFDLPALAGERPQARQTADVMHVVLFWSLCALVCVHALAAAHHHWWRGDATLRRMLPGRARRTG